MNEYYPDIATPPSEVIKELLKYKRISRKIFASSLDKDADYVKDLLSGKIIIDKELAFLLEKVLGGSVEFWLFHQKLYDSLTKK